MFKRIALGLLLAATLLISACVPRIEADPINYIRSLANVLVSEGGARYTNHPQDPGGPTKYGITIADVRLYLDPQATPDTVKALTQDQAATIYRRHYWKALRADELPRGLDYTVFDYGVNSGVGRSGRVLRRVLGLPDDDWHVTDEVLAAVKLHKPAVLITAINDERQRFLQGLRTFPIFGRGWSNRVHSVRLISGRMANPIAGASVTFRFIPRYGPYKAYEETE